MTNLLKQVATPPSATLPEIPFGYCHCGCGQKTRIARNTDSRRGQQAGLPVRFIKSHSTRLDLTGQRFGRLVVLWIVGSERSHLLWRCRCDCGKMVDVPSDRLRRGRTTSCGCFQVDHAREVGYLRHRHGHTSKGMVTAEYRSWKGTIERCFNQKNKRYKDYGGRGITVCDRWRKSFENFLADMGPKPSSSFSIDRINNDGNYDPGNCRWATAKQQARNRRNPTSKDKQ